MDTKDRIIKKKKQIMQCKEVIKEMNIQSNNLSYIITKLCGELQEEPTKAKTQELEKCVQRKKETSNIFNSQCHAIICLREEIHDITEEV